VWGWTPRQFQAPKRLNRREPGNRVFEHRLLFGQDGQSVSPLASEDAASAWRAVKDAPANTRMPPWIARPTLEPTDIAADAGSRSSGASAGAPAHHPGAGHGGIGIRALPQVSPQ
jgi:hypothetical protein